MAILDVKGKGRASPLVSERTPLLASPDTNDSRPGPSRSSSLARRQLQPQFQRRQSLHSKLLTTFLVTLSVVLLFILLLLLLAYSYGVSAIHADPQDMISHAVYAKGPHAINVLNATQEGVWIQVDADVGLDADWIMGLRQSDDDVGFIERAWRGIGRWGVRKVGSVVVDFKNSEISLSPEWSSSQESVLSVTIPPFALPLTAGAPVSRQEEAEDTPDIPSDDQDLSWLTPISIHAFITPSNDTDRIRDFLERTWRSSRLSVRAVVSEVEVRGGQLDIVSWRDWLTLSRLGTEAFIRFRLPSLPGLPQPGRPFPRLSSLITLVSYSLRTVSSRLVISVLATAPNPFPPIISSINVPMLPFTTSLVAPDNSTSPIANVTSQPRFTRPNITLPISGAILPISASSSPLLSTFVSNYLSTTDSPISIMSPLFPNFSLSTVFPAPKHRPRVLRDLHIKNMKVSGYSEGSMLASGVIYARITLPPMMEIDIQVHRVLPDALVFNGDVHNSSQPPTSRVQGFPWWRKWKFPHGDDGDDEGDDLPPRPPLPDPLPDRAFARIRPNDWLIAETIENDDDPDGDEEGGTTTTITANFVNVPLEVLPGREAQFRNFLSKVVFARDGALAGIQGVAAVGVEVPGLIDPGNMKGELELTGLPFEGQVRIGRRKT